MATEESTSNSAASNSPSVDSYLGSVISLTSKSEIRYEGVLVSINPKESTISLQNVKSYGTEGRRKEGPQIPPGDKVYEFILFRGTDIKDLQVKSTPNVPPKQHISNDPAIIQSQYAYAPPTSVIPATSVGAVVHTVAGQQSSGPGQQFPGPGQQFPGSDPGLGPGQQSQLYQTGSQYGYGVPSPFASVNGSVLSQGYIGASSNQTNVAQSVSFNPLLANSQYPSQPQNFPENANYPVFPSQSSNPYNTMSTLLSRNTPLASSLPSHVQTMPTLTSYSQEVNNMNFSSSKTSPPETSFLHGSSMPLSSLTVTSSINTSPMLRPEQLTNVMPPASYVHQQYTDSRNTGVLPPSMNTQSAASAMPQEPLLPLPMQAEHGGGQQFNDEFDFTAMNEKFNKDEVWGSLEKNKQQYNSGYGSENHSNHYNTEASDGSLQDSANSVNKPVYKKDDFFDTISCNRGGWNAQNGMHDRRRLDTETFGEYQQRPPMGRGNYGGSHSGYYRGSYNRGRGYGYYGGRGSRGGYRPNY